MILYPFVYFFMIHPYKVDFSKKYAVCKGQLMRFFASEYFCFVSDCVEGIAIQHYC